MSSIKETTSSSISLTKNNFPEELSQTKSLLRFLTCGSVDDGKSTLIGRLLYETGAVFNNELESLTKDSKKFGTNGEALDYALLVDGLSSEREQGITIDVAYRFFSTSKRKFIVADTPGHEQYTRNMVTGASTSDCAVIMIDARKGLLPQTKRHSTIASLLGIKKAVIAVNKIDLIDYDQSIYQQIKQNYLDFARYLHFEEIHIIPVSALKGDNIVNHNHKHMPWYQGPSLLSILETIQPQSGLEKEDSFKFCVQWVNRPNLNFRGFSGRVVSGELKAGDKVKVLPSGKESTIEKIVTFDGELDKAIQGESITLTLDDEIDISRGDVIVKSNAPCEIGSQFQATITWMSEKPLIMSRQYLFKIGTDSAVATPNQIKHKLNIENHTLSACSQLHLNEIGVVELNLNKPIAFEPYQKNKTLGGFILIDRVSNETVACGFIDFVLRRSGNIHKQNLTVDSQQRSSIKGHLPVVIWLTGLSGAGKSTIANLVESQLNQMSMHTYLLDGDNIRHGLNKDLGFTEQARAENIRRTAEVSKLMCNAGLITLVSFISPFKAERRMAKELIGENQFLEIHIDVPLEIAEQRDVKGLYKKARKGQIKNFTGIDSPYEKPSKPDLYIDTSKMSAEKATAAIITLIKKKAFIS